LERREEAGSFFSVSNEKEKKGSRAKISKKGKKSHRGSRGENGGGRRNRSILDAQHSLQKIVVQLKNVHPVQESERKTTNSLWSNGKENLAVGEGKGKGGPRRLIRGY